MAPFCRLRDTGDGRALLVTEPEVAGYLRTGWGHFPGPRPAWSGRPAGGARALTPTGGNSSVPGPRRRWRQVSANAGWDVRGLGRRAWLWGSSLRFPRDKRKGGHGWLGQPFSGRGAGSRQAASAPRFPSEASFPVWGRRGRHEALDHPGSGSRTSLAWITVGAW